jgi:hypothetical protein
MPVTVTDRHRQAHAFVSGAVNASDATGFSSTWLGAAMS